MFFPDVARATAEFARVLRPGGRLCSSVWAGPGENPWTTIAMAAIAVGEPARERIAKAVIAKAGTYERGGRIRIPGAARCIVGTKWGRPNWSVSAQLPSRGTHRGRRS
jgi:SAM-dependent methyltransferase